MLKFFNPILLNFLDAGSLHISHVDKLYGALLVRQYNLTIQNSDASINRKNVAERKPHKGQSLTA
jgi:hypothetical protein